MLFFFCTRKTLYDTSFSFHPQDVDRDGDHIRCLVAAADRHQLAQRLLPADGHVETLLPVLFLCARRGHELDVLQPVPVRVAERELPKGVQTGVAVLAQQVGVRFGGGGRVSGPPGPGRPVPVREDVQRQRHLPGNAAAHVRRAAVRPDHRNHRLHGTGSCREFTFYNVTIMTIIDLLQFNANHSDFDDPTVEFKTLYPGDNLITG